MRVKTFLVCAFILTIAGVSSFFYGAQPPILVVNVALDLNVYPEFGAIQGYCSIMKNTNVSLVKWPQTVSEKVDLKLRYKYYNETRGTPVQFIISLHLNQTEKVVTISNLTMTGAYTGSVTSFFSGVKTGKYNLTITAHVSDFPETRHQLHRFVTVP